MDIFSTATLWALVSHPSSENKSHLIEKNCRLHLPLSTIELHCSIADLSGHSPQTQINAWTFMLSLFVEISLAKPAVKEFPLNLIQKQNSL